MVNREGVWNALEVHGFGGDEKLFYCKACMKNNRGSSQ